MKKELDYFNIEELYGGNQEIFSDLWMRGGGCAAVTACDLSIYLDLYKGTGDVAQGLYPFDLQHLTKESYERFAMLMKPYLVRALESGRHFKDLLQTVRLEV